MPTGLNIDVMSPPLHLRRAGYQAAEDHSAQLFGELVAVIGPSIADHATILPVGFEQTSWPSGGCALVLEPNRTHDVAHALEIKNKVKKAITAALVLYAKDVSLGNWYIVTRPCNRFTVKAAIERGVTYGEFHREILHWARYDVYKNAKSQSPSDIEASKKKAPKLSERAAKRLDVEVTFRVFLKFKDQVEVSYPDTAAQMAKDPQFLFQKASPAVLREALRLHQEREALLAAETDGSPPRKPSNASSTGSRPASVDNPPQAIEGGSDQGDLDWSVDNPDYHTDESQ